MTADRGESALDLYWLPLDAGGRSVRLDGKVFEAVLAGLERRPRYDLYHSALVLVLHGEQYVIEQAPAGRGSPDARGVVATGAVGMRALGRLRVFRYEVRCWRDGVIPDLEEAVASPVRVSDDPEVVGRVLELAARVPARVWGRDADDAGEMWNSNSIVSWLLVRSDVEIQSIRPPEGGRAPGWDAGIEVARRTPTEPS